MWEIAIATLDRRTLDVLAGVRRICGGCPMREFSHHFAQPTQLSTKLLDDKFDHPDGFMKWMANFFFYGTQSFQFAVEFAFQKSLTTLELFEDCSGRGLPLKAPST